ncbi:MAG: hypothetical protein A2Y69_14935 [Candidatus Aminicenantes bacterium RBG_13_59_9]|nr:MAG: hypothetical protein A2Y69_14935 [Candidatus Aminicenantes bacterium RBG_13_59_9]
MRGRTKIIRAADAASENSPDLKKLFQVRQFLDEMAISIRNIIFSAFPKTTAAEREDIEQEVKLKLWKAAARGKNIENFRSYLWRVVWTTAYDVVEGRTKACSLEMVPDSACTDFSGSFGSSHRASPASNQEFKLMIDEAVEALPPRRRSAVRLYCLGLNHLQIAQTLSLSESQARHLLYRGINEIKSRLKGTESSVTEPKPGGKK